MIAVADIEKAFLIIGIYMDDGNALSFLRIFEQTLYVGVLLAMKLMRILIIMIIIMMII